MKTLLHTALLLLLFVVLLAGPVSAQGPTPAAPTASPTGPGPAGVPSSPGAPNSPGVPNVPGARITTGQAPVVGGNAAGARERALDDALRQAVDQTIDEFADPQARAAAAKTIRAIETKARSYVGSYRTLEEGETAGIYTVRIEAEVDRVAVRTRLERGTAPAVPAAGGRSVAPSIVVLPGEGATPAFAAALAAALSTAGLRARAAAPPAPASGASATVTAETSDEGPLRGTGRVSVACRGAARFSGLSLPERAAATRAFANDASAGQAACLDRLAAALATEMASALASAAAPASDLPVLTIDADVVEPAAVAALLKSVRAVGAVSSADLVRVGGGHAEIRARTRSASAPLAVALSRDAEAMISLSDVQASGAVIKLRARLRAPAAAEAGSNP